jgi:hypothetical protein
MEPEGSSPCSQEPSNGPYPVPDQSNLYHPTLSISSILILFAHLRLGLPSGLFPPGFATNILYAFLFSPHLCYMPCPSHSPRLDTRLHSDLFSSGSVFLDFCYFICKRFQLPLHQNTWSSRHVFLIDFPNKTFLAGHIHFKVLPLRNFSKFRSERCQCCEHPKNSQSSFFV